MVSTVSGYGVSGYGSGGLASMLQSFYAKADANSDSSLSKDELIGALSKTGRSSDGSKLSSAVDELVGSLDSDSSGTLGATEFSSFASQFDYGGGSTLLAAQEAAGNQPPPPPPGPPGGGMAFSSEGIASVYSDLDSDGSGGVGEDELGSAVASYLSAANDGTTDAGSLTSELFGSLDSDSDGSVSQDELTSALEAAQGQRPPPPMGPPPANDSASSGDPESSSSSASSSGTAGDKAGGAGSAGAAGGSSTTYDPLDTNQDGYVSAEERLAGTSGASSSQQASGVTSNRLGSDTLRFLMSSMNEVAAA